MDSLTQITLGAAVGEIVLGKKLGNRAVMWGAIAGTIPDLDVIANAYMTEIEALAVHRGFSHSIFFAVFVSIPIAWCVFQLYQARIYQMKWYKGIVSVLNLSMLIILGTGMIKLATSRPGSITITATVLSIGLLGYLAYRLYHFYFNKELEQMKVSYQRWYLLFFWAFLTHIGLDCFTAFGTQIFQPFWDYRVAFNTISVVDPVYSVPFLLCVIAMSSLNRNEVWRRRLNLAGITMSSIYLMFTVWNKWRVDQVFEQAIANREIPVIRYRTSPTILNNFLWNCVAETDTHYYIGLYSLFDSDPNLHILNKIPKHHDLIAELEDKREIRILKWFSDGYYALEKIDANTLLLSDLRYGGFQDIIEDKSEDMVFNFYIKNEPGQIDVYQSRKRPDDVSTAFNELVMRIKGH